MKMEQSAAMNNVASDIRDMRQGRVNVNDIKWDLIKIIEPHDGLLATNEGSERIIRRLFNSYLSDLKYCKLIQSYDIQGMIRNTAITYDVTVKLSAERSPKKLKIHVGVHQPKVK